VPHIHELAALEWVEIPENCNWQVSVENYSACHHCPSNHPTFAEGVVKPETYDIQPDAGGGYVLRHTNECQSLDNMTYLIDLGSSTHVGDYQSWFLWPIFSFQCYPGNVLNTYHGCANTVDTVPLLSGAGGTPKGLRKRRHSWTGH
jgi:phenylpropionate dioxygenase-like ring-hydroxylating dioxygenase large terminal subunit